MRSRRPTPQQAEAVSRRLAQLSAELAVVRAESVPTYGGSDGRGDEGGDDWVAGRAGARAGALPPGTPDTHTRIRDHRLRSVGGPAPSGTAPAPAPAPQSPAPQSPAGPAPGQAPSPVGATPSSAAGEPAPQVPVPGRHAARRPGAALAELVPATMRGRAVLAPGPLAVLAVAVALGLAVTSWWIVRNDPEQVPAPVPAAHGGLITPSATPLAGGGATGAPAAGASPEAGAGTDPAEIVVDVAGKVRRPGIAVLPPGSRVVDAVEAAGGAKPGVDLSGLNLARLLVDGEQILVGAPAAAGVAPGPPAPGAPSAGGALVNINTADQSTLETLPGVGPVTAQAIIDWRTEHGGFSAVEELLEVSGIGDATLAELAPHVTV